MADVTRFDREFLRTALSLAAKADCDHLLFLPRFFRHRVALGVLDRLAGCVELLGVGKLSSPDSTKASDTVAIPRPESKRTRAGALRLTCIEPSQGCTSVPGPAVSRAASSRLT